MHERENRREIKKEFYKLASVDINIQMSDLGKRSEFDLFIRCSMEVAEVPR